MSGIEKNKNFQKISPGVTLNRHKMVKMSMSFPLKHAFTMMSVRNPTIVLLRMWYSVHSCSNLCVIFLQGSLRSHPPDYQHVRVQVAVYGSFEEVEAARPKAAAYRKYAGALVGAWAVLFVAAVLIVGEHCVVGAVGDFSTLCTCGFVFVYLGLIYVHACVYRYFNQPAGWLLGPMYADATSQPHMTQRFDVSWWLSLYQAMSPLRRSLCLSRARLSAPRCLRSKTLCLSAT